MPLCHENLNTLNNFIRASYTDQASGTAPPFKNPREFFLQKKLPKLI
jgi:hypothetical protein